MLTHVVLCVNIEIEQRKNNKKQKSKEEFGNGNERIRNQKNDV